MNEASTTGESGKAKVAWTPFQVRDLSSVSDAQSGFTVHRGESVCYRPTSSLTSLSRKLVA